MKKIYINDLKYGDKIEDGIFRVETYEEAKGKNNSSYIKVILQDKTGKSDAKIWSNSIGMCEKCKPGDIVKLTGNVDTFNNSQQIIISKMQICTDVELSDFISTSFRSGEEMMGDIEIYINSMKNKHLKNFLSDAFQNLEFRKKFLLYPAGKSIHHSYIGGLCEHVLDMLQMSDKVLINHPLANADIVRTGIILHDIGKLDEFEETNLIFNYSLKGKMLGHIFMGALWFNENIPADFPEDLKTRITHIILSHHGKKEFGSPVLPQTYEAVIVNKMDDISYSLNAAFGAYNNYNGVNEFSDKLLAFNNEMLYLRPASD